MEAVEVKEKKKSPFYKKVQILQAERFADRADLVEAILEDDELYTLEQVDAAITKFLKGKVV